MRRPISQQMSFGDGFIDASLYELDDELKQVDELLSDPRNNEKRECQANDVCQKIDYSESQ